MKGKSRALNLHLGSLKDPWEDYCKSIGKLPGAALKEAIQTQLKKAEMMPEPKKFKQVKDKTDSEPKKRFEILLTASEKKALIERAESELCSPRQWVIDAIRAGLTKEPQFGMKEIELLGDSNYQLLAIGRNINQIAKQLNERKMYPVSVELIEMLRKEIDNHTDKVSQAISASLERWTIE